MSAAPIFLPHQPHCTQTSKEDQRDSGAHLCLMAVAPILFLAGPNVPRTAERSMAEQSCSTGGIQVVSRSMGTAASGAQALAPASDNKE